MFAVFVAHWERMTCFCRLAKNQKNSPRLSWDTLALSPCKGKFQSFGDCGTPPSPNPLMLILYDNHTQNTPLCQVWTWLVQYSLSYQRFRRFLQCAYGVSSYFSTGQWRYITFLYSFDAQLQCASGDVRHLAWNPTVQEKMTKTPSKTGFFDIF